jgi:hypothetical protein
MLPNPFFCLIQFVTFTVKNSGQKSLAVSVIFESQKNNLCTSLITLIDEKCEVGVLQKHENEITYLSKNAAVSVLHFKPEFCEWSQWKNGCQSKPKIIESCKCI